MFAAAEAPPAESEADVLARYDRMARLVAKRRAKVAAQFGHDVEDLTQDALVAILKAHRRHDLANGTPFSYVAWKRCHSAVNSRVGHPNRPRRKGSLKQQAEDDSLEHIADHRRSCRTRDDASELVEVLLRQLPPEQKETLELLFGLGGRERLPAAEAAHRLGISEAGLYYRQRAALDTMAEAAVRLGLVCG